MTRNVAYKQYYKKYSVYAYFKIISPAKRVCGYYEVNSWELGQAIYWHSLPILC